MLSEPALVAYLAYLQYWQRPEYARFLSYPAALAALELLQAPEFRTAMASPEAAEHVWRQQFYAWQYATSQLWPAQAPQWRGRSAQGCSSPGGGRPAHA